MQTPITCIQAAVLALALGTCCCPGAAVAQPTAGSIELPGPRVFPESVTSTSDGTIYVGSLATGGVMRVPPGAAKAEPWISPGTFGSRSIFGVLADEARHTLWVCSNDVSARGIPGPNSEPGSSLIAFDLTKGTGKARYRFPGAANLCNDIAIGPDGTVYVTNSLAPQILRLRPGATQLETFVEDPLFAPPAEGAGLDGLAFGADGNLYVDKFTDAALLRVAVKDGKPGSVTQLSTAAPLTLADALRPIADGHAFLLIEGSGKLDRVTIAGDRAEVTALAKGLNGPTGVTPNGQTAWVSEGQLPYLFGGNEGQAKLPFDLKAVSLTSH